MKKVVLIALVAATLTGCMASNIAARYTPTPDESLVGLWFSDNIGSAQYLKIVEDGTGEMCWENTGEYKSTALVISDGKMITVSETELEKTPTGFKTCKWGLCADYKKITENRVPAGCKVFFNQK